MCNVTLHLKTTETSRLGSDHAYMVVLCSLLASWPSQEFVRSSLMSVPDCRLSAASQFYTSPSHPPAWICWLYSLRDPAEALIMVQLHDGSDGHDGGDNNDDCGDDDVDDDDSL